jgi:hypothetical protein
VVAGWPEGSLEERLTSNELTVEDKFWDQTDVNSFVANYPTRPTLVISSFFPPGLRVRAKSALRAPHGEDLRQNHLEYVNDESMAMSSSEQNVMYKVWESIDVKLFVANELESTCGSQISKLYPSVPSFVRRDLLNYCWLYSGRSHGFVKYRTQFERPVPIGVNIVVREHMTPLFDDEQPAPRLLTSFLIMTNGNSNLPISMLRWIVQWCKANDANDRAAYQKALGEELYRQVEQEVETPQKPGWKILAGVSSQLFCDSFSDDE